MNPQIDFKESGTPVKKRILFEHPTHISGIKFKISLILNKFLSFHDLPFFNMEIAVL